MATLDFFRNVHNDDRPFFDEGPAPIFTGSFANTTGSINTSLIDAFRQGVEITQQKHFDAGVVKIHAGEPGHILRKNYFGEDRNFRSGSWFQDRDYFSPETYIRVQVDLPHLAEAITFPIITSDNDQLENFVMNGVIEPFTIRARASFFSMDIPFESHEVKGCIMAGNTDPTLNSDQVLSVDYFDPLAEQIFYLDMVDMFSGSTVPLAGMFETRKLSILPFEDKRFVRNANPSTNYDPVMSGALSLMTGSTDSYISFKQRSQTSGFVYESNTSVGTDSIAFGGMVF